VLARIRRRGRDRHHHLLLPHSLPPVAGALARSGRRGRCWCRSRGRCRHCRGWTTRAETTMPVAPWYWTARERERWRGGRSAAAARENEEAPFRSPAPRFIPIPTPPDGTRNTPGKGGRTTSCTFDSDGCAPHYCRIPEAACSAWFGPEAGRVVFGAKCEPVLFGAAEDPWLPSGAGAQAGVSARQRPAAASGRQRPAAPAAAHNLQTRASPQPRRQKEPT
jgi:hypothetical protein